MLTETRPEAPPVEPDRAVPRDHPAPTDQDHRWLRFNVLALLVVGVAITLYLGGTASSAESEADALLLEQRAAEIDLAVEVRLGQYIEVVHSLQGLMTLDPDTTRDEFAEFIAESGVYDRLSGFQALEWAPVVMDDDLAAYEDAVRAEGFDDFAVSPVSRLGRHVVVDYIVPFEGNEQAFGFDLTSNSSRKAAVDLAESSGRYVATGPITLMQETGDAKGFLILAPVYDQDDLAGVVLAVFRVVDMLDGVVDSRADNIHITDVTGVDEPLFGELVPADVDSASRTVLIGSRVWRIDLVGDVSSSLWTMSFVLQIAGVLITIGVVATVLLVSGARDRAERRADQATLELQEANEVLLRSNADLQQFASVASHDLQTPVRNIMHAAEFLAEDLLEIGDPSSFEYLGIIEESGQRMRRLVNSILEYASVEPGDDTEAPQVDLNEVVEEVLNERETEIEELGAVIDVGVLPPVTANPIQVFRVVDNLVGNALKYRHPKRVPHIRIARVGSGLDTAVVIEDNGLGFDQEQAGEVFTMFRRLHAHSEIAGSGMGLAIVQRIIEQAGGSISADSTPGEGSTFTIRLFGPKTV